MDSPRRHHRYYDLILTAFVVVLLCSNFIGAGKVAAIDLPYFGNVSFGGGILFFPIAYFFGDTLTEVYGYAYDRRAVWAGFAALAFAAVMTKLSLPCRLLLATIWPITSRTRNGFWKLLAHCLGFHVFILVRQSD